MLQLLDLYYKVYTNSFSTMTELQLSRARAPLRIFVFFSLPSSLSIVLLEEHAGDEVGATDQDCHQR
jgi:hypothetical protein